jgi:hypothetical protein
MLLMAGSVAASENATDSRLDEVQRRGARVMPFSLEQTTHIFTKTDKGGIQQVIAKENADADQIGLIRSHLAKISRQFAQGDFSDPAKIHGDDMPGLAALREAEPGRIRIEYEGLKNGGQIVYSADDPGLIGDSPMVRCSVERPRSPCSPKPYPWPGARSMICNFPTLGRPQRESEAEY